MYEGPEVAPGAHPGAAGEGDLSLSLYIYMHIYIYMYTHIHKAKLASAPGALSAKRAGILGGYRDFAEKKGVEWR